MAITAMGLEWDFGSAVIPVLPHSDELSIWLPACPDRVNVASGKSSAETGQFVAASIAPANSFAESRHVGNLLAAARAAEGSFWRSSPAIMTRRSPYASGGTSSGLTRTAQPPDRVSGSAPAVVPMVGRP